MSPSTKELVVVVLDVTTEFRESVVSSLFTFLHSLILFRPRTEFALFGFGTKETSNSLNQEMQDSGIRGQYLHVTQICPLHRPSIHDLVALDQISKATATPDCFDALTVGMDHLKKRLNDLEATKGVTRQIILISDFAVKMKRISASFRKTLEGTLTENEIQIEVFWLRIQPNSEWKQPVCSPTEDFHFASVKEVTSEAEILSLFPVQPWSGRNLYRGEFEIHDDLKINVKICKQTRRARMPTLPQYHPNVSKVVKWRKLDDPTETVSEEFHNKAYTYGSDVVPITEEQLDTLTYHPDRGIQLIGFIKLDQVPRYHYLKEAFLVLPDDDPASKKAWSVLARGCRDEGTGMLIRAVLRKNAMVLIALLVPSDVDSKMQRDSFIMNVLPFSDDVRGFHFGSFSKKKSLRPSDEQMKVMEELINRGRLDQGQKELLNTDRIANPTLHKVYRFLGKRAANQESSQDKGDRLSNLVFEPDLEMFGKEMLVVLEKAIRLFKKPEEKPLKQEYEDWKCRSKQS